MLLSSRHTSARHLKYYIILFILLTLPGCLDPTRGDLIKKFKEHPSWGAYVRDIPFYPQKDLMCGPSALTSMLNYYGSGYSIGSVEGELFKKKLKGTLLVDMLTFARLKGFHAKIYNGGPRDLKRKLRRGRPLILFINQGLDGFPLGHFVVVIGFDDDTNTIIAHSGRTRARIYPADSLIRAWKKTAYTTLLITP